VEARVWDSAWVSAGRLALLIGLIFAFVRLYDSNQGREPSPKTAREILDERFSKGEISREDYEMRRKALSS
jgi:uncharacterized membrane protein